MRGIKTKTVAMKIPEPHKRVVNEEAAHFIAATFVEVDGGTPRRMVFVREVRRKTIRVIAHRTEVVVDHVEDDGQVACVAGIDEALEAVRSTVRLEYGEEKDTVVTPAAIACELVNGHHFNVRNAEIDEVIQVRDRAVKGSFLAEGADVELVDDAGGQRWRMPIFVGPRERVLIIDPRRRMNAIGLPSAARVRISNRIFIDEVSVIRTGACILNAELPPATILRPLHRPEFTTVELQTHLLRTGSPNFEFLHCDLLSALDGASGVSLMPVRNGSEAQQERFPATPAFVSVRLRIALV